MVFQSLQYAGQYPPLVPRSPNDIASFAALHASLRALPELSKEGDKILNEEMLAKLVDGIMRFQRDHLGRVSFVSLIIMIQWGTSEMLNMSVFIFSMVDMVDFYLFTSYAHI